VYAEWFTANQPATARDGSGGELAIGRVTTVMDLPRDFLAAQVLLRRPRDVGK
jgi:hypothetical protein